MQVVQVSVMHADAGPPSAASLECHQPALLPLSTALQP